MRITRYLLISVSVLLVATGCFESKIPLTTQKINHDGLQARLVLPAKNSHDSTQAVNTVIVLGGAEGGMQGATETAKKFAEHGIAALAVGYFAMPGLPENLNNIPLEYFDAAIKFIDSSAQLTRNHCQQIPVIGSSRGAELALLLGANNQHLAPIIAISPSSHSWGALGDKDAAAWTVKNEPLPFVPRHSNPDYSVSPFVGVDYFSQDLKHPDAQAAEIDVSKINGQVLLIAGDDDRLWPAAEMAESIYAQFNSLGLEHQVEKIIYQDAGHVITPGLPSNIIETKMEKDQTILLGGNKNANENAQSEGLNAIIKLINSPICFSSKASFNTKKLENLHEFLNSTHSSSVVLMRAGEVIFEFGDIFEKHTIHSIRKPMLNALFGIYVDRGIIDLDVTIRELGMDDNIPLTESEKQASIRQLLMSRSGIYLPSAATSQAMLEKIPQRGANAPGEQYVYNNWDFNVAGAIFEKLVGESVYTAFHREIAQPLGMKQYKGSYITIDADTQIADLEVDGFYQYEPEKSKYPAYHFRMSAYDLALFGQLYENYGVWKGKQILSRKWIEESTTSYSVTNPYMDFGYGMLWNVINANKDRPNKAFYHTGTGVHMLGVYPSSDLVFVHRVQTESDYEFNKRNLYKIIASVFDALEERTP